MHLFLLFLYLLDQVAMVTPASSCLDMKDTNGRPTKNCKAADLSDIPPGLEPETEVLLFPDNLFTALTWSSFQAFPQIYEIDLTGNKIPEVTPSSSSLLPTLRILRLGFNCLTSLSDHSFSACPALTELYLDNNNIHSLSDQTFSGLSKLEILYLSANHIKVLPRLMLQPLRKLETLNIEKNSIKVMPDEWFGSKDEYPYLFLSANPWDCDCHNRYLYTYVIEFDSNIYVQVGPDRNNKPESVECASPPSHKDKPVMTLEESDLCPPEVNQRGDYHKPPTTVPPTTMPPTTMPPTTVPPTTMPPTTMPPTTMPPTTMPPTTVPPTTMPPTTMPPTTVPPTTMPPTTMPPTTVPPTTMPPTTMPPTTMPPTTMPPTTMPPTTMPPTTMPPTTLPSTTLPSTTLPSTTMPPTTMPQTTLRSITMPSTTMPPTTMPSTTMPSTTLHSTTMPSTAIHVLATTPSTHANGSSFTSHKAEAVFCFWLFAGLLLMCVASAACMLLTLWRLLIWYLRVYRPLSEAVGRKRGSEGLMLLTHSAREEKEATGGGVMALYRSVLYIHREGEEAAERGATAQEEVEEGTDQLPVSLTPTGKGEAGGGGGGFYRKTLHRLISREAELEGWRDVVEECRVSAKEGGRRGGGQGEGMSRERSEGGSRKRYSVILREEKEEAGLAKEKLDWVVGGWEVKRGDEGAVEPRSSWGEWLEHYLPRIPWGVTTPTEEAVPQ